MVRRHHALTGQRGLAAELRPRLPRPLPCGLLPTPVSGVTEPVRRTVPAGVTSRPRPVNLTLLGIMVCDDSPGPRGVHRAGSPNPSDGDFQARVTAAGTVSRVVCARRRVSARTGRSARARRLLRLSAVLGRNRIVASRRDSACATERAWTMASAPPRLVCPELRPRGPRRCARARRGPPADLPHATARNRGRTGVIWLRELATVVFVASGRIGRPRVASRRAVCRRHVGAIDHPERPDPRYRRACRSVPRAIDLLLTRR